MASDSEAEHFDDSEAEPKTTESDGGETGGEEEVAETIPAVDWQGDEGLTHQAIVDTNALALPEEEHRERQRTQMLFTMPRTLPGLKSDAVGSYSLPPLSFEGPCDLLHGADLPKVDEADSAVAGTKAGVEGKRLYASLQPIKLPDKDGAPVVAWGERYEEAGHANNVRLMSKLNRGFVETYLKKKVKELTKKRDAAKGRLETVVCPEKKKHYESVVASTSSRSAQFQKLLDASANDLEHAADVGISYLTKLTIGPKAGPPPARAKPIVDAEDAPPAKRQRMTECLAESTVQAPASNPQPVFLPFALQGGAEAPRHGGSFHVVWNSSRVGYLVCHSA
jgi:hypothetical protein